MTELATATTPATSAILLAAGASRRMRTLKALLDWLGRPLIIHQIVALREAGADEVVVVLGHRADELQARIGVNSDVYAAGNVRCVINRDFMQGKTTSIKAGVRAIAGPDNDPDADLDNPDAGPAGGGSILLLNVDQPRGAPVIRRALAAHHSGAGAGALITIPTCRGKGGHPIIVSRSLRSEMLAIDESTQGMRAIIQRRQSATQRVELGCPELLWDVNTPEQYRAALAAARSK